MIRFYSQHILIELKRAILNSIRVLDSITMLILLKKKCHGPSMGFISRSFKNGGGFLLKS